MKKYVAPVMEVEEIKNDAIRAFCLHCSSDCSSDGDCPSNCSGNFSGCTESVPSSSSCSSNRPK